MLNRGTKVHPQYGIIEIKHIRRYEKFDLFVFTHQAIQVYYVLYSVRTRDKLD